MADTFSQIYIHIVFAVKHRQKLIPSKHKISVHKYITGIINHRLCKMIAIHCMPDHIHVLIGIKPSICISDLVREIKIASGRYINEQQWMTVKFQWQEGFAAFSYSHSQITSVAEYIKNQENRHRVKSFQDEYLELLNRFNICHDNNKIFDPET